MTPNNALHSTGLALLGLPVSADVEIRPHANAVCGAFVIDIVGAMVTHADPMAERSAALAMPDTVPGAHPKTISADKAYDTRIGGSAIDGRTTRHPGYAISQTIRKRIEEHFRWGKTVA